MGDEQDADTLLRLTAQIVSAHVSNHEIEPETLAALIRQTHSTLRDLGSPASAPPHQEPAVPIRRSVFPDYIVCLEDGKKLKLLKRHLQTAYGLSANQYREKWGLPASYPMVAPNYAQHRSTLAKEIGLGRKPPPIPSAQAESQSPRRKGKSKTGE